MNDNIPILTLEQLNEILNEDFEEPEVIKIRISILFIFHF